MGNGPLTVIAALIWLTLFAILAMQYGQIMQADRVALTARKFQFMQTCIENGKSRDQCDLQWSNVQR